MKSAILFACLIVSATCAPQKSAGLERESEKKNAKLQFTSQDAQVYSVAGLPETYVAPQVVPQIVVPQGVVAERPIISSYYGAPGVSSVVGGIVPYSSVGQTVVTTSTGNTGLPEGTVYEHHGQTHIGHTANAVHIRRPGHLYANPIIPGSLTSGLVNGQVQYINGQPAQYINGQWYYVNAAQLQPTLESVVYTNGLNRPNVPSSIPIGVQGINYGAARPTVYQVGSTGILGVRPNAYDNKWYTKTNTQPIQSPFFGQPQYVQVPAASSGTKTRAAPRIPEQSPVQSETEKNDW